MKGIHHFDPYAKDKEDAFAEQVKENIAMRKGFVDMSSKQGKRERILIAVKSAQTRKGKAKVSLAPVKFLDKAE